MAKEFVPDKGARVLVVGDIILDRYVYGDTSRISPEAPVPVVKVCKVEERPGGAANVAVNVAALGLKVNLMGVSGDDDNARSLESQLDKYGVESLLLRQGGYSTIAKLRVLSQNQQLLRLDYEASADMVDSSLMLPHYQDLIVGSDVVVLSDYAKGSLKSVRGFIDVARKNEVPVLIDPKGKDFERYRGATLLTPNLSEFRAVAGDWHGEPELDEKATDLCIKLELDRLLITRGKEGMTLYERHRGRVVHQPAVAHEVFDVTGAGDTVIATLAAALASACSIEDAIRFANTAAGLVVEKLGTAVVGVDELNSALDKKSLAAATGGICTIQQLEDVLKKTRNSGKKIVMANGCFDILHAGHVAYLNTAKTLGDLLVVAVNDDDSVRNLKGGNRPINPLKARMEVLSALTCTDWICSFSEDTPEKLVRLLKPDVLVKGEDYQEHEIVGAEFVKSYGGEVARIPFENEVSSSSILDKIMQITSGEKQ